MLWFLRGLRRGVVTTRYPAGELDEWTVRLPSAPAFHPTLLTDDLADRLEAACPPGALTHERDVLVLDLGACTGCGHCLGAGHRAVEASGEFLLAARDRGDLIKHIPIGRSATASSAGVGSQS